MGKGRKKKETQIQGKYNPKTPTLHACTQLMREGGEEELLHAVFSPRHTLFGILTIIQKVEKLALQRQG